jgi:hypothetical protein
MNREYAIVIGVGRPLRTSPKLLERPLAHFASSRMGFSFLSRHPESLILMRFVFLNRVGFWSSPSNQRPCCYESSSRLSVSILLLFDGFTEYCNCVYELFMLWNECVCTHIMFQFLIPRSQPDMTRFQAIRVFVNIVSSMFHLILRLIEVIEDENLRF